MKQGRIVKSTRELYYVETSDGVFASKPRGVLRKENTAPLVGDFVILEDTPNHDGFSIITKLLPRDNFLVRPPLANLDYMVVVVSTKDPRPNYVTLDKMLATLAYNNIPALLAVTKTDLAYPESIVSIYELAGYSVFLLDYNNPSSLVPLIAELEGKISAFAGNSGVGKTTLLNALDTSLELKVAETSKKLGRGKHTTRHVEIFTLQNGLRIADTPGFSAFDLTQTGSITKQELSSCFLEFQDFSQHCEFRDCGHIKEVNCAVRQAVEAGEVSAQRYQSYLTIFSEIKDIKDWERKF